MAPPKMLVPAKFWPPHACSTVELAKKCFYWQAGGLNIHKKSQNFLPLNKQNIT